MKFSIANFLDPFQRGEAAALFRAYNGMDPVTADQWLEKYAKFPNAVVVVAETEDGDLGGFAMGSYPCLQDPWYKSLEAKKLFWDQVKTTPWIILEIHVAKSHRNKFIGTGLLRMIQGCCRYPSESILGTFHENRIARHMYEENNWIDSGIRIRPPGFKEDQIIYRKSVSPSSTPLPLRRIPQSSSGQTP